MALAQAFSAKLRRTWFMMTWAAVNSARRTDASPALLMPSDLSVSPDW